MSGANMTTITNRHGLEVQKISTFSNVRVALREYDREMVRLNQLLDDAKTIPELKEWERQLGEAHLKVQLAFHEDTKEINPVYKCLHAHPDTLRKYANIGEAIERGALPSIPAKRVKI